MTNLHASGHVSMDGSNPTRINSQADFNARDYGLSGHDEGLRMNDPITLASLFEILTHADNCTGCSRCLVDGN